MLSKGSVLSSSCSTVDLMVSMIPPTIYYVFAGKKSNVVYSISCSCGQGYIGEIRWRLEMILKEHLKMAARRG